MKTAVFTSAQPRHISLIERLASISEVVYAAIEVNTLFPGEVADFFDRSPVMQDYFSRVMAAEKAEFGEPRYMPANVRVLPMKMGDLNRLDHSWLTEALSADVFVVLGASYIKGQLVESLVERKALNIHMGTSPYYRGSSCNFWALYDGNPEYVGATVHLLTKGLDSGPMLCHALPSTEDARGLDGFALGMRAVSCAFDTLVDLVQSGRWQKLEPVEQNRSLEMRYTRSRDFDDLVAAEYLERQPTSEQIIKAIKSRDSSRFILLD